MARRLVLLFAALLALVALAPAQACADVQNRVGASLSAAGAPEHPTRPLTALPFTNVMTAKEQLRQTVDELTEAEAADTLDYLTRRRGGHDALTEFLDNAPIDDEPTTPEEDEGAREAREQVARGEVFSAEQIKREIA